MFSFFHRLLKTKLVRLPKDRRVTLQVQQFEDRVVPTLLGQSLFPADNPWNQRIATAPVAANSSAIINNIVTKSGNGRLHPDFGQAMPSTGTPLYGIPYNIVHGNTTPKVRVVIDAYPGESDLQDAPIPSSDVIEGDFQNGPNAGVDNRGDSHLIVWDQDNNIAYEFYRMSRPSENADGLWHADQETIWDMKQNTFRTLGKTSADAAGLAILPGLVRPDEGRPTTEGGQGVINHAIRFTLQNSIILNQFIYPASHIANSGSNVAVQPAMGARFRLKSTVDISILNPESRVIAQAMKDYGMILADNGSNFFFSGASYSVDSGNHFVQTWNDDDIQDSTRGLKSLHFNDFEVVDLTPLVTGLSSSSGAAGTSVTVAGQNFSGAAGRLQVYFGNTMATSATVLNDNQVVAIAPPGTGTVDVRVQSGVNTPANPQNIKSTIFGYGVSPLTTAARFTYGVIGNQPPTVVTAVSATSNSAVNNPMTLNVVGADDGGEPNLAYTWTSTGPAAVQFSTNGSNAAKNTIATFSQAGSYTFQATITDTAGLIAISSVNVKVLTVPPAGIVGRGSGDTVVVVSKSNGSSFTTTSWGSWPVRTIADVLPGDFNGDHIQDIAGRDPLTGQWYVALSNGSSQFTITPWGNWAPANVMTWVDVKAADLDGDGKTDLVGRIANSGPSAGQWWASLSTGTLFATRLWDRWSAIAWSDTQIGDLDGDGKADLISRVGPGSAATGEWWASLSTGTNGLSRYFGSWGNVNWLDVRMGDLNGDGKADVIGRWKETGQWWASLSTGTSWTTQLWATWSASVTWVDVNLGDMDGNGRADLVGRVRENGQWYTTFSMPLTVNTALQGTWSTSPNVSWVDVRLGDFDGDGKIDIAGRYLQTGQWYVSLSRPTGLFTELWATWNRSVSWIDIWSSTF